MTKYRAVRTEADGIVFASKREARRYQELRLLQRAGQIRNLALQPTYTITINGEVICKVILDFQYEENGQTVIEDSKGMDNPLSRLKRKLVEAQYGIKVRLV